MIIKAIGMKSLSDRRTRSLSGKRETIIIGEVTRCRNIGRKSTLFDLSGETVTSKTEVVVSCVKSQVKMEFSFVTLSFCL